MTTVRERTRSVIETSAFLARLSQDKSLPNTIGEEAKQLLRHYPTAEAVRLAGRCEAIRQAEISKLSDSPSTLHPALATWPLLDPFFCDSADRVAPQPNDPPALAAPPPPQPIPRTKGKQLVSRVQVSGLFVPKGMGCLSIDYRYFASSRAQVLSRAALVLGSPTRASNWFVSRIQSLNGRSPCTLMQNAYELALVMNVLTRLEHGIF